MHHPKNRICQLLTSIHNATLQLSQVLLLVIETMHCLFNISMLSKTGFLLSCPKINLVSYLLSNFLSSMCCPSSYVLCCPSSHSCAALYPMYCLHSEENKNNNFILCIWWSSSHPRAAPHPICNDCPYS